MGDSGIVVRFGDEINTATHRLVQSLSSYLDAHPFPGMIEFVPAFTTVYISYNSALFRYNEIEETVAQILQNLGESSIERGKTIEIPVCYDKEFGPDIVDVASHNGLSVDEVISIHTSGEYLVYMIGFAPGFPYIGGMSEKIATPRRSAPRLVIPAGTVGIAGMQTGVYPIETPGGWQLIGRTPAALFRPKENPPSLLAAGDIVHFREISKEEFDDWPSIKS